MTEERSAVDVRIRELLHQMTLTDKIGQLNQIMGAEGRVTEELAHQVRSGLVGSLLNEVDRPTVNELQRIAVEESRLGIPLLVGRDVIHGFRTILPIPLGQAAAWDPDLVRRGARMAAREASQQGVRWTFAPMVDICRDPRWGRVAECLGEDPHLAGKLAAAMVRGFQGEDLARPDSLAACAKHFAGYGASEAGRDYNSTNIPERELRSVHLPPFRAALQAGACTFMASFCDLDGIPASANRVLMTGILREEWGFDGFVVSDWESIPQLCVHGLCADPREAARTASRAGVDVDMMGRAYLNHLADLVAAGELHEAQIDLMVSRVLRVKLRLGLFEHPYTEAEGSLEEPPPAHLDMAYEAAAKSVVLLKNDHGLLPLSPERSSRIAVIGPLAREPREQLGTWIFDGDPSLSITPLEAIGARMAAASGGGVRPGEVRYVRGLDTTRSRDRTDIPATVDAARWSDVVVLCLGEESVLSGEGHCRTDLSLPGAQEALIRAIRETGTPVVLVVLAGRPLALDGVVDQVDALLMAWHPGTMAGPALADLLFGEIAPSGRLPITFPRVTGQIPIYYGHRMTGRPPSPETFVHMDDLPRGASQHSAGAASYHLDTHYTPLFPFGFGLTYTSFAYRDLRVTPSRIPPDGTVEVSVEVENTGERAGVEVVQLYIRDPVASVTRPVRELKGFRRVPLEAGERRTVTFALQAADLAFPGQDMAPVVEAGLIQVWVGGDSRANLEAQFEVI